MVERVNIMRNRVSIPAACRERFVPLEHPAVASWQRSAVVFSGISDLVPGYQITSSQPTNIMLIATVGGRGLITNPSGTVVLDPGTLYVGAPKEPVGWGVDGPSWRIVWWYIQPTALWRGLAKEQGSLRPYRQAHVMATLCDAMLDRMAGKESSDQTLARHHADAILLHLRELAEAGPTTVADDGFAALWQEIALQLHEPWSISLMAKRLGLSPSSLQREAKRRLGRSVHQELIRLRMEHARTVLQRTVYPLQVVAEQVGFTDAYTFSAAYRRWAGHSPGAERKND